MEFSPDSRVIWEIGSLKLNATIVFTWVIMVVITTGAWFVTRGLSPEMPITRWQNTLEIIVERLRGQIRDFAEEEPDQYLTFIGTLFLFIAVSNALTIFPWYVPPTASLSTTSALAICVLVAVPVYGIRRKGLIGYLRAYFQPTPLMLPFHIMGELSRTLALAVRLFGNVMSGATVVAILIAVAPLFFPIVLRTLGLLTGLIQAYIFAALAMVYIASGVRVQASKQEELSNIGKE